MNFNSAQSSQRLPTFRDIKDVQKALLPLSRNRLLNKKIYVPNLDVSRRVANTNSNAQDKEDSPTDEPVAVQVKKEQTEPPRRRNDRKPNIIQTDGIFCSGVGKPNASGKFGNSANAGYSITSKVKQLKRVVEKLDDERKYKTERDGFRGLLDREAENFEKQLSISVHDLPVSVPKHRIKTENEDCKIYSLLTSMLKPNNEESPLFLLKTPKYVPAVLDESDNPTINVQQDNITKSGFKCTMHDLPEGQIGKLQVMKSGKLRLVLGECKFWLQRGKKVNFKEELAVIKTDEDAKTGEIINLGEIQDRVIIVPENIAELIQNV